MKKFRRNLYIFFVRPADRGLEDDEGEYYNPSDQTCYIFQTTDVIQCINHAQLHFLIQTMQGTSASRKFDKVAKILRKKDKWAYDVLY